MTPVNIIVVREGALHLTETDAPGVQVVVVSGNAPFSFGGAAPAASGQVAEGIAAGSTLTIAAGWQQLLFGAFSLGGTLNLSGRLVLL
ncbi:MAG: hypothetical protein ACKVOO_12395 [Burkholderiaceae bacterium]